MAWFYRILRNAITDNFRRQDARTRAHQGFAAEAPLTYEPELQATVCACIGDVVQELKPECRDAIEQVDWVVYPFRSLLAGSPPQPTTPPSVCIGRGRMWPSALSRCAVCVHNTNAPTAPANEANCKTIGGSASALRNGETYVLLYPQRNCEQND